MGILKFISFVFARQNLIWLGVIGLALHYMSCACNGCKVSKCAKIRNRYNQVPHPTQDTNGKVAYSQLDTTNENQEASPIPAGDHKAHINRRVQRHNKH